MRLEGDVFLSMVGYCLYDIFRAANTILVHVPSNFFTDVIVNAHTVLPYNVITDVVIV